MSSDSTPATDRELEPQLTRDERPADPPESGKTIDEAWELVAVAVRRVNLRDAGILARYWVQGGVVRIGSSRGAERGWEASAFLIDEPSGGIVGGVRAGNASPALALEELAGALDAKSAEVVLKDAMSGVVAARDPRLGQT